MDEALLFETAYESERQGILEAREWLWRAAGFGVAVCVLMFAIAGSTAGLASLATMLPMYVVFHWSCSSRLNEMARERANYRD